MWAQCGHSVGTVWAQCGHSVNLRKQSGVLGVLEVLGVWAQCGHSVGRTKLLGPSRIFAQCGHSVGTVRKCLIDFWSFCCFSILFKHFSFVRYLFWCFSLNRSTPFSLKMKLTATLQILSFGEQILPENHQLFIYSHILLTNRDSGQNSVGTVWAEQNC